MTSVITWHFHEELARLSANTFRDSVHRTLNEEIKKVLCCIHVSTDLVACCCIQCTLTQWPVIFTCTQTQCSVVSMCTETLRPIILHVYIQRTQIDTEVLQYPMNTEGPELSTREDTWQRNGSWFPQYRRRPLSYRPGSSATPKGEIDLDQMFYFV